VAVKIRLARGGAKKAPYYRVVVANSTAPRDGDFLEKVGTYNPMLAAQDPARISLKSDRILYWLSQGAQPSDRVAKFITSAGIALPEHITKKIAVQAKVHAAMAAKRKEVAGAEAAVKAKEEAAAAAEAKAAEKEAEKAAAEAKAKSDEEASVAAVEEVATEEAPAEVATEEAPAEVATEEKSAE
jgi:small subunit ribosomal protein S16